MSNLIAKTDITDELIQPVVTTAELTAADKYFEDIAANLGVDLDDMSKDEAGCLTGGSSVDETIATWNAITAGSFNVTIDSVAHDITNLNFSTDTTMAGIAARIQTAVRAAGTGGFLLATVTYDATNKSFIITSGTRGSLSSVAAFTAASSGTDISGTSYMKCTSASATATAGTALPYKVKELLKAYVCQTVCKNKAGSAGTPFQSQNEKDRWAVKLSIYEKDVQRFESQMTETVILGTSTTVASIGVITIERG